MKNKTVTVDAHLLQGLAIDIFDYYQENGEDGVLRNALEMGLIEERMATQKDIDEDIGQDWEWMVDLDVGDIYYYIGTLEEMIKRMEKKK